MILRVFSVFTLVLSLNIANASDYYNFTKIAEGVRFTSTTPLGEWVRFDSPAINNMGEVAFSVCTNDGTGNCAEGAIYIGDGITQKEVVRAASTSPDYPVVGMPIGVNDSGWVAYHTLDQSLYKSDGNQTILLSEGYYTDTNGTIRSTGTLVSACDINEKGQIATPLLIEVNGVLDNVIALKDGINPPELTGISYPSYIRYWGSVINNSDQAAAASNDSRLNYQSLIKGDVSGLSETINLGPGFDFSIPPGFNDRGDLSYASFGNNAVTDQVLFLDDKGISVIADASDGFNYFIGQTSLNDNNAVAFTGSLVGGGTGVFVGFPNGTSPVPVLQQGEIIDGHTVTAISHLQTNSMNDEGQIALYVSFDDQVPRVYRADPLPGLMPGNPILPDPASVSPGQWDMEVCLLCGGLWTDRVPGDYWFAYIDPVIAVGYDYEALPGSPNVASLIIPAPLKNGDNAFTVQFNGLSIPVTAGQVFNFTDYVSSGVTNFSITDIDTAELLDPADPTAFVTGLIFTDYTSNATIRMKPHVVNTDNVAPYADAGPDRAVRVFEAVDLDASASTDPDGDTIQAWKWTIDSSPSGSAAVILGDTTALATFTPDIPGQYIISLIVNDGWLDSLPSTITIDASDNLSPVASLSADVVTGLAPLTITLDASGSYDPEGFSLTYGWDPEGTGSFISDGPVLSHTYVAPGQYLATIEVKDDLGATSISSQLITVSSPANTLPIASPTSSSASGDAPLLVDFFANASDGDGDQLTYAWYFDDPTSLNNTSDAANPNHTFATPGEYHVTLLVSDGMDMISRSMSIVVTEATEISELDIRVKKFVLKYEQTESCDEEMNKCHKKKTGRGQLRIEADINYPVLSDGDIIKLMIEGSEILAIPVSDFRFEDDLAEAKYKAKHAFIEMKVKEHKFKAILKRLSLLNIVNSNGVEIVVSIGSSAGVVILNAHDEDGKKLVYESGKE